MGWYVQSINWLQAHMLQCPSKKLLHIDCPGCGLQRSVIDMLKGNLAESWQVYPPGIFLMSTWVLLIAHLIFGFRYGAFVLKILYLVSVVAIVINYAYKVYTKQIF